VNVKNMKFILLIIIAAIVWGNAAHPNFPYRQELAKEVRFWKLIFTRYGKNDVVIHDARYPNIIYRVFHFDASLSERQRSRQIKRYKKRLQNLLKAMEEKGEFSERISAEEKRILNLFKNVTEEHKFKKAAGRIRTQQGIREQFVEGIIRSGKYLDFIRTEFKLMGLPEELVYLPHLESSFNPAARSHVGAAGLWQLMRRTGRYYLKINRLIDQRLDPYESTRAAAKILKYNYRQLRDWPLAITAYNHGVNGIKRAVKKLGSDYIVIRNQYLSRRFGFASKSFYPEFLAVVEIMDSLQYYFPDLQLAEPLNFHVVQLRKRINLKKLLRRRNIDIQELKKLNPAIKKRVWKGYASLPAGYEIKFPLKTELEPILTVAGYEVDFRPPADLETNEENLKTSPGNFLTFNDVKPGVSLSPPEINSQKYLIALLALEDSYPREPSPASVSLPAYASVHPSGEPAENREVLLPSLLVDGENIEYYLNNLLTPRRNTIIIAPTETFSHLSEWLRLPVSYLRRLNGMSRYQKIYVGDRLRVEFSRVTPEKFLNRRMRYHKELISQYVRQVSRLHLIEYTVQPGETLWQLAHQKYKFPLNILFYFNNFDKLEKLIPGETIYLPLVFK